MPRDVVEAPKMPTISELLGRRYSNSLKEYFPDVMPPTYPCGYRFMVQLRTAGNFKKLANGSVVWFPDESVDRQKYEVQTGLVRALGPSCFKNRTTLVDWPEGPWCRPGQFVRVPMHGGDRLAVPIPNQEDPPPGFPKIEREATFVLFNDQDCLAVVTGDPLDIKARV